MIQLQYVQDGKNAGGLYVNVWDISAVRASNDLNRCFILLNCGVEFEVLISVMNILEEMRKLGYFEQKSRKEH